MNQIVRGTTELASYVIYFNGQLTNADGDVTVSVIDADYGTSVGGGGTAYNDPELGKYTFELDTTYTSLNRVLQVNWAYTVNGNPVTQQDFYTVYTPYASVSSIIDYYDFGTRPQDLNYRSVQELTSAEQVARYQIDNYTQQTFGRVYGNQEQFGYGSDALEIIQRMVSLTQLYEDDVLVIDYTQTPPFNSFGYDVQLTPTGKAIRIIKNSEDVIYDGQSDPTILYYGRFRDGARYNIYGELGWSYVPTDISWCAIKLAGNYLSQDSEWRQKYLKKVNLGEISFELGGGAFNGTGDVVVDSILDGYRNIGITII